MTTTAFSRDHVTLHDKRESDGYRNKLELTINDEVK